MSTYKVNTHIYVIGRDKPLEVATIGNLTETEADWRLNEYKDALKDQGSILWTGDGEGEITIIPVRNVTHAVFSTTEES